MPDPRLIARVLLESIHAYPELLRCPVDAVVRAVGRSTDAQTMLAPEAQALVTRSTLATLARMQRETERAEVEL